MVIDHIITMENRMNGGGERGEQNNDRDQRIMEKSQNNGEITEQ